MPLSRRWWTVPSLSFTMLSCQEEDHLALNILDRTGRRALGKRSTTHCGGVTPVRDVLLLSAGCSRIKGHVSPDTSLVAIKVQYVRV